MLSTVRVRAASKAASIHLGISALIGLIAAALVFGLWFPYPYRGLAGGQHLFLVMVSVDVVCGPLLTAVLFTPSKSRRELTLDLSLISIVQLAALAYGVHVISQARPVALAFEMDRLVAVAASQIDRTDLPHAPAGLKQLSWTGPVLVGTREPKDGTEKLRSIQLSLQGLEPSARPSWWQTYEQSRAMVKQHMKKLAELRAHRPGPAQAAIDEAVAKTGLNLDALFFLPLTSQKMLDGWIALIDAEGRPVGYAPVDGF